MSSHADTIRPLLAAMGTGYATPEDYDAALAALDALLAENQRLREERDNTLALYMDAIRQRDEWKELMHDLTREITREALAGDAE